MRRSHHVLGGLVLAACFAALTTTSAFARSFESQITEANSTVLKNPGGLAIDSADNLWVSDAGTSLLSKFDSSGNYLAQNNGAGSWSGSHSVQSLAYGKTANLIFAVDSRFDDLWGIKAADATYADVDFHDGLGNGCCSISAAVDNSGTATDGYVYVATGGLEVLRFDSSGNPANFTAGSAAGKNNLNGADTPTGSFNSRNVAVDSNGNLYVVNPYHAVVYKFAPSGAYLQTFDGTGAPGGFSGAGGFTGLQGVAIDPSNENVLVVDHGNNVVDEFDSTGVYLGQLKGTGPSEATPFGNLNGGIAVNSAGYVYVADEGSHVVDVFTPAVLLPKLTYGPVTNETHTSGTLNGAVDLNGGADVTSCQFQYGTNTSYGSNVPCSPSTPYSTNASVSADLTGLTPDTTYHYRLVVETANGIRKGTDQTFTPHAVADLNTDAAGDVTASSATLNASFGGEGEDVHYFFEWGTDESFGDQSATPPGVLVSSPSGPQSVSFGLSHLEADTTYHYRVVASDAFGTTIAPAQTFRTLGRYQFSATYGSTGSGDGQLDNPMDVAVNASSGALYVADAGNHRVVKFDSSGAFIAAWGWGVGGGGGFEVCSSGCQAGLSGPNPGQFKAPTFIEVDNSNGPSQGDVYAGDITRGDVQKLDSSGNLIESWGSNGAIDFSGDSPIQGVTVDNDGNLFVGLGGHWTELGQDGVFRATISTGFYAEHSLGNPNGHGIDINSFGTFYQASGDGVSIALPGEGGDAIERGGSPGDPSGLAVDRSTGDLYVGHGAFIYQFLGSDVTCFPPLPFTEGGDCEPADVFGVGSLVGSSGLAFSSSTGIVYAANSGADNIAVFLPFPVPQVTTKSATQTGTTSVTLNGHVDPQGPVTISDCYFEYGTDSTLALGIVPCDQPVPISSASDVSAKLTGLSPFASYRYRLVATQSDGQGFPARGRERSVTPLPSSPPGVEATASSEVTGTSARLSVVINPNLAPTTYVFQYGSTTSYGSNTLTSASVGDDNSNHSVSTVVTGLSPGTDYHFRVVAVNLSGTTQGPDQTFTTPGATTTESSPLPVNPSVVPSTPDAHQNCAKLARRAQQASREAVALRRRAARSSHAGEARTLRGQARRLAKEAGQLSRKAKACGGANREAIR
jgi:DNA-binding beta-propeller fold protein YncE